MFISHEMAIYELNYSKLSHASAKNVLEFGALKKF